MLLLLDDYQEDRAAHEHQTLSTGNQDPLTTAMSPRHASTGK